jgi:prepilin-type N-terminal cleavage/methylation domain-containing protein
MKKTINGFTIVELLIVIVVIGILVAISLVSYNGVKNRANDAAVLSDMNALAKNLAIRSVDSPVYPEVYSGINNTIRAKLSRSAYDQGTFNLPYCLSTDGLSYMILGRSKSGNMWSIQSNGSIQVYSGVWSTGGGHFICNAQGFSTNTWSWGYQPPAGGTPGWQIWTGI